ncbi:hypothetical protein QJS04_geneDACA021007 [Acorus gramineus]|uniref:CCHC-type domain-containing protein n=1 Tax=Acorus gramineus TaxID=55184 RepID=A0AAV9B4T8_ACOGR|nr:hypothetical protein QJS04_geneDACA021007 [Acorus gramineus]
MASAGFSSERGSCYACGQRGHWARDCPSKRRGDRTSSGPFNNPPVIDEGPDYPEWQCRCGRGACLVLTSRTAKNPGRKFYRCPVSSNACRFFMWCDTAVPVRSFKLANLKYPTCACGAGKCKLLVWNGGENDGREYFACPLRKGQGACKFFQWVDAIERDHKIADSHLSESMSRSPHSAPYVLMDSEASNKPEDVLLHESIKNEASPSPSPSTKGCAVKYENTHELLPLPPTERPVLIVGKSVESSVQLVKENFKSFECQDSEQSYPICACGAGRCSVLMWNIGDSAGRKYFACPVERGKGACNFFQWVSDVEGKHELAISRPGESNSWSPQSSSKELNDTEPMDKETSNTTEEELSNGSMDNVPSSPSSKGCPANNVNVIERLSLTDDESVESFVKLGQEAFNLLQCVHDIEGRHNLAISHPGESISWSSHSPSKEFNDSNSMDQETSNVSDEEPPDGSMDNEPSSSPSNKGCPVNDVTTSDLIQMIQSLNLDDGEQVESFIEMGKGVCNFFQWVSEVEEKHDLTISHPGESNHWSYHSSSKELNDTYSMDKETGDIIEEELLDVSMDNEPSSASSKGCPAHNVTATQSLSLTVGTTNL